MPASATFQQRGPGLQGGLFPGIICGRLFDGIASDQERTLDINREVTNGMAIYRIAGRIDGVTTPELESAVTSTINGGTPRVIFDMRAVTYVSSAGLRVILSTAKRAKAAQGGLAIFGLQSEVNEVFEISGFQNMFPIVSDENEARSRLGA
jgi:anti-anti-sigma factor